MAEKDDVRTKLTKLTADILDIKPDQLKDDTNFFQAGGDSVAVMKLVQVGIGRGLPLTAQMVYEHPTLEGLSQHLASMAGGNSSPKRLDESTINPVKLYDLVDQSLQQCQLQRSEIEDIAPCTPFQGELIEDTIATKSWMFQTVWELQSGSLDRAKQAIGQLYERNAIFRTRIVKLGDGKYYQVVAQSQQPEFPVVEGSIEDVKSKDYERGFAFGESLSRFSVVKDGAGGRTYLLWTKTHAIYDRTTKQHWLQDVQECIQDPESFLAKPVRSQFPSFARHIASQDRDAALNYWSPKLAQVTRHDALFPDELTKKDIFHIDPRNSVKRAFHYSKPKDTNIGFGAISEIAWALTLANRTESHEAFFGAFRGGRHQALPGVESVCGPTWAPVPAIIKLGPHSTLANLLQLRQQDLFQEIEFEHFGIEALNKRFGHKRFWQSVLLPQMPEPDTFKPTSDVKHVDAESGQETILRSASELWTHIRPGYGLYIMTTPKSNGEVELWARYDGDLLSKTDVESILEKLEQTYERITRSSQDWKTTLVSDICPHIKTTVPTAEEISQRRATLRNIFPHPDSHNAAFVVPSEHPVEFSYKDLSTHIRLLQKDLADLGIKQGDAVSISLPNSYEIVSSFLAVSWQRAIAAPLNPNYKQDEFEFYIEDLGSALMIIDKGAYEADSAAVRAAKKFNAAIAEVQWDGSRVRLSVVDKGKLADVKPSPELEAEEEDIALVLHTSGTTGRPKAVPLTHKNLMSNIDNIVQTYALAPSDRTMLVMPLFHVHGLLASFLSPLRSGGSAVVCAKLQPWFWKDFVRLGANWYSATPTMHRLILGFPAPNILPAIRFIRSCSSQLAPALFYELEKRFEAPVLESYAMTEASHMMSSNPLPPAPHYPGCVGLPQGAVRLAILDTDGDVLPQGSIGEICVRGANVTHGYLNNPSANSSSFTSSGFFRTGDQGKFDEKTGYLTLTGRLKELINKGGEKISPNELDNLISQHEDVQEAVAFAVEDEEYGQDVGIAVRLKGGASLDKNGLKTWIRERVAAFKVPRDIWFLGEIPKTATGKLQRKMVAERVKDM